MQTELKIDAILTKNLSKYTEETNDSFKNDGMDLDHHVKCTNDNADRWTNDSCDDQRMDLDHQLNCFGGNVNETNEINQDQSMDVNV